ncbi:MAG: protein kinase [Thermodesulfobacteriota bacterium]
MTVRKLNCWEYKKCGREPGGIRADELGICPAASDASFSGINSGICGGRFCWAVAGTFCGERCQGTFAEKRDSCMSCDFYQRVKAEEGTANLRTKFLQFISLNGKTPLLHGMAVKQINSGERFIRQGDPKGPAYIIQRGTCIVLVEKDGKLHPAGHRGEGDIVGVSSILTGEPRPAHVEAETDMEVWVLDQNLFDSLSGTDPDLMAFLTELVAARFDSKRPTADRTIGKYLATQIIGRGGYSIVYKGLHTGLNMPVAIKMMRHDLASDESFLTTFRNEARIIAGLSHENIIKVFDIEERFRTIFIIMEYVEGESLDSLLNRLKRIPPAPALRYIGQTLAALEYAHRIGIIHRDINLTNIFVLTDDRIKVLDFGLACPIGTEDFASLGSPLYMAPEQIRSDPLDARTDIYSLGISTYQMVTGEYPFRIDSVKTLMDPGFNEEIPDPALILPELPAGLLAFIRKASRRNPAQRFQSAREALEALRPLYDFFNTSIECFK